MKTSHFSENFDLCHPQLGSDQTNNNLTINAINISSEIPSKLDSTTSALLNFSSTSSSTAIATTYGSSSSDHQPSKYEKNANELLISSQQRQQEQNKKRKRETGEYSSRSYPSVVGWLFGQTCTAIVSYFPSSSSTFNCTQVVKNLRCWYQITVVKEWKLSVSVTIINSVIFQHWAHYLSEAKGKKHDIGDRGGKKKKCE